MSNKSLKSSAGNRILPNLMWWTFGHGLRMCLTFAIGFWVMRHLGPSGFGQLSAIRAVLGIINVLAAFGLTQLLPVRLADGNIAECEVLLAAGALRFAGGITGAIVSVPILFFVLQSDGADALVLALSAAYLMATSLDVLEGWFLSQTQSKFAVFSRLGSTLTISGLQLVAVSAGFGLTAFLAIDLAGVTVYGVLMLIFAWHWLRPEGRLALDRTLVKSICSDSLPIWLAAAAASLSLRIDQVMLRVMLDAEATGLYAAAARLSEFWCFVPVAIIANVLPMLVGHFAHDPASYRRMVLLLTSALTVFSLTTAVVMTAIAPMLVVFLFGSKFLPSSNVLILHVWSLPFYSLGYLSHNLRIVQGQQASLLRRTVFGAAVNIVLNACLIPCFGINAAAAATLVSYFAGGIGWDLWIDRSYGLGSLQLQSFHPANWLLSGKAIGRLTISQILRSSCARRVPTPFARESP